MFCNSQILIDDLGGGPSKTAQENLAAYLRVRNLATSGQAIRFGPGTYNFPSRLELAHGKSLVGTSEGGAVTTLRFPASDHGLFWPNGVGETTVSNLVLDGSFTTGTRTDASHAICFENNTQASGLHQNIVFHNVRVANWAGDGWAFGNCRGVTVTGGMIANNVRIGVSLFKGVWDLDADRIDVSASTRTAVNIDDGTASDEASAGEVRNARIRIGLIAATNVVTEPGGMSAVNISGSDDIDIGRIVVNTAGVPSTAASEAVTVNAGNFGRNPSRNVRIGWIECDTIYAGGMIIASGTRNLWVGGGRSVRTFLWGGQLNSAVVRMYGFAAQGSVLETTNDNAYLGPILVDNTGSPSGLCNGTDDALSINARTTNFTFVTPSVIGTLGRGRLFDPDGMPASTRQIVRAAI